MAQAMDRLLAVPSTSPSLPSRSMGASVTRKGRLYHRAAGRHRLGAPRPYSPGGALYAAPMQVVVDPHDRLRAFLRSGAPPDVVDDDDAALLAEAAGVQGLSGLLATALQAAPSGPAQRLALRLSERRRALAARGLRQLALAG